MKRQFGNLEKKIIENIKYQIINTKLNNHQDQAINKESRKITQINKSPFTTTLENHYIIYVPGDKNNASLVKHKTVNRI